MAVVAVVAMESAVSVMLTRRGRVRGRVKTTDAIYGCTRAAPRVAVAAVQFTVKVRVRECVTALEPLPDCAVIINR